MHGCERGCPAVETPHLERDSDCQVLGIGCAHWLVRFGKEIANTTGGDVTVPLACHVPRVFVKAQRVQWIQGVLHEEDQVG